MADQNEKEILHELQRVELEVLGAIATVCAKHEIIWWLDSGTALGARRHGGFIPWDDDIDIGMMREDYDRFCAIAPTELPEGFSFHNARTEERFAPLFSKVWKDGTKFFTQETLDAGCEQGIFVDVFPYDYIGLDGRSEGMKKKLINAQRLSYLYHARHIVVPDRGVKGAIEKGACRFAHYVVRSLMSKRKIVEAFDSACKTFDTSACVISSAYAYGAPIPADVLLPTCLIEFEGKQLPCPGQVDRYLEIRYGDWRQLPPENQRKTHLPLVVEF